MSSMNKSEEVAYDWLIQQKGYDEKEVIRKSSKQTPDFKIKDGPDFEVKRNYNGTIIFYETQLEDINEDTNIVIVDNEVEDCICYSQLENKGYTTRVQEQNDTTLIRISPDLKEELDQYSGSNYTQKIRNKAAKKQIKQLKAQVDEIEEKLTNVKPLTQKEVDDVIQRYL